MKLRYSIFQNTQANGASILHKKDIQIKTFRPYYLTRTQTMYVTLYI